MLTFVEQSNLGVQLDK